MIEIVDRLTSSGPILGYTTHPVLCKIDDAIAPSESGLLLSEHPPNLIPKKAEATPPPPTFNHPNRIGQLKLLADELGVFVSGERPTLPRYQNSGLVSTFRPLRSEMEIGDLWTAMSDLLPIVTCLTESVKLDGTPPSIDSVINDAHQGDIHYDAATGDLRVHGNPSIPASGFLSGYDYHIWSRALRFPYLRDDILSHLSQRIKDANALLESYCLPDLSIFRDEFTTKGGQNNSIISGLNRAVTSNGTPMSGFRYLASAGVLRDIARIPTTFPSAVTWLVTLGMEVPWWFLHNGEAVVIEICRLIGQVLRRGGGPVSYSVVVNEFRALWRDENGNPTRIPREVRSMALPPAPAAGGVDTVHALLSLLTWNNPVVGYVNDRPQRGGVPNRLIRTENWWRNNVNKRAFFESVLSPLVARGNSSIGLASLFNYQPEVEDWNMALQRQGAVLYHGIPFGSSIPSNGISEFVDEDVSPNLLIWRGLHDVALVEDPDYSGSEWSHPIRAETQVLLAGMANIALCSLKALALRYGPTFSPVAAFAVVSGVKMSLRESVHKVTSNEGLRGDVLSLAERFKDGIPLPHEVDLLSDFLFPLEEISPAPAGGIPNTVNPTPLNVFLTTVSARRQAFTRSGLFGLPAIARPWAVSDLQEATVYDWDISYMPRTVHSLPASTWIKFRLEWARFALCLPSFFAQIGPYLPTDWNSEERRLRLLSSQEMTVVDGPRHTCLIDKKGLIPSFPLFGLGDVVTEVISSDPRRFSIGPKSIHTPVVTNDVAGPSREHPFIGDVMTVYWREVPNQGFPQSDLSGLGVNGPWVLSFIDTTGTVQVFDPAVYMTALRTSVPGLAFSTTHSPNVFTPNDHFTLNGQACRVLTPLGGVACCLHAKHHDDAFLLDFTHDAVDRYRDVSLTKPIWERDGFSSQCSRLAKTFGRTTDKYALEFRPFERLVSSVDVLGSQRFSHEYSDLINPLGGNEDSLLPHPSRYRRFVRGGLVWYGLS